MLYFGLYVQLRRGSVAGYTTDENWAYGPKEGVEAFESIIFFIRFIYAINFEHLLISKSLDINYSDKWNEACDWLRNMCLKIKMIVNKFSKKV